MKPASRGVLELLGGGGILIAGLGVDGLPEMQDDLGLFGLLERDLAGASHDGGETAALLGGRAVVAVIEEDLRQLGHGLLAGLLHRVEVGGVIVRRFLKLPDLGHGNGPVPPLSAQSAWGAVARS